MREYSRISPRFWTGVTGKQIKDLGPSHQVVAMYLMTSPHANMIGLYYLPILYLSHESGIPDGDCKDILKDLEKIGFASYDHDAEVVWIFEAARYQVGENPNTKQAKGAANKYQEAPNCKFLELFAAKYGYAYGLTARSNHIDTLSIPIAYPIDLRAQEQDQARAQSAGTGAGAFPKSETGTRITFEHFIFQISKAGITFHLGQNDRTRFSKLGEIHQFEIDHALERARQAGVKKPGYVLGVIEGERQRASEAKDQPAYQDNWKKRLSPRELREQEEAEAMQARMLKSMAEMEKREQEAMQDAES